MRFLPWRVPLSFTIRGICERFASIVISICMDGRPRIRKYLSGKSFVRLPKPHNEPVNIMRGKDTRGV